jgi:hypothetical protein
MLHVIYTGGILFHITAIFPDTGYVDIITHMKQSMRKIIRRYKNSHTEKLIHRLLQRKERPNRNTSERYKPQYL